MGQSKTRICQDCNRRAFTKFQTTLIFKIKSVWRVCAYEIVLRARPQWIHNTQSSKSDAFPAQCDRIVSCVAEWMMQKATRCEHSVFFTRRHSLLGSRRCETSRSVALFRDGEQGHGAPTVRPRFPRKDEPTPCSLYSTVRSQAGCLKSPYPACYWNACHSSFHAGFQGSTGRHFPGTGHREKRKIEPAAKITHTSGNSFAIWLEMAERYANTYEQKVFSPAQGCQVNSVCYNCWYRLLAVSHQTSHSVSPFGRQ